MQQFTPLAIPGVLLIKNFAASDERGIFVKTFHQEQFLEMGIGCRFTESYYSVSGQNVIRGMHFQAPPYQHDKLVYVTAGRILDVVLDLRTGSGTYGKYITAELEAGGQSIFIPSGCAHGFLTLSSSATVVYNVTSVYHAAADNGVKYDSFGFNWPVNRPVISVRDNAFPGFDNFKSPF